jgi:hypothetical protein
MLSSWRMYEMHLALFLKAGCDRRSLAGAGNTEDPDPKFPPNATISGAEMNGR